jgi:hypothetical protein
MPHDGSIMLTLGFWSNETSDETSLYVSAIELVEAP